jgi:hypothetical protein
MNVSTRAASLQPLGATDAARLEPGRIGHDTAQPTSLYVPFDWIWKM